MTLPTTSPVASPPPTRPAVVSGVDLDAVTTAVRACPGVDDLDAGPLMSGVTTYLPGRKLDGLKVTPDTVTVSIRSVWGVPVTQVGEQVRIAIAHLTVGRQVDIVVSDLTPAPGYEPQPEPQPVPVAPPAPAPAPAEQTPVQPPTPTSAVPPVVVVASVQTSPDPEDAQSEVLSAEWLDAPAPTSGAAVTTPAVKGVTVVERTVTITEKVVVNDAAAPLGEPQTSSPMDAAAAAPAATTWVTSTPSSDAAGGSSSAPTTPTPAGIPPRS